MFEVFLYETHFVIGEFPKVHVLGSLADLKYPTTLLILSPLH